jgi:curved DNA-binding protein
VKFQDYYSLLGIDKSAPDEQIHKAYRKLARKYHPDVNKGKDAEEKFKQLSEAYEALKDPEKRARYDQLGAGFRSGQEFRPPPGFNGGRFDFTGASGFGTSGFSDFFEALFGGGQSFSGADIFGRASQSAPRREALEAELCLTPHEAIKGGKKTISLQAISQSGRGGGVPSVRTLNVTIPPLAYSGLKIRVGKSGSQDEVLLRIKIIDSADLRVSGDDLMAQVKIAPWEAMLGTTIPVNLADGEILLSIPAGSQSGQKLRVRGRGIAKKEKGARGDLFCELQIVVPKNLTDEERELVEKLSKKSTFKPRGI